MVHVLKMTGPLQFLLARSIKSPLLQVLLNDMHQVYLPSLRLSIAHQQINLSD